jgi:UDP-N-acetylmuramoylalanine--D-glutamate ligase
LPLHDEGIYVLEMSSYQLEACSLIEFDVGILLNITPDHLDRHGGMPGYVHAKQLIFKGAHCGVIGLDDPQVIEIYEFLKPLMGNRLIPISIKNHLDFGYCLKGTSIYRNGEFLWDMQEHPTLKGEHNAQNIMAVWGALHILGFLDMDILHTFMQFKGLAHRQEYVLQTPNGITFINDSKATNADATIQALKAYDQVYLILGGKPKAGGIGDLIPYFHKIRHALLIGEAANEFSGVLERYGVEFTITNTLEETLKFDFESQSTVLLSPACASFDQFDNFEQRGDMFKSLVLSKFEMY